MEGPILSMQRPLQIAWSSSNEHPFHPRTKFKTQLLTMFKTETHDCFFGTQNMYFFSLSILRVQLQRLISRDTE